MATTSNSTRARAVNKQLEPQEPSAADVELETPVGESGPPVAPPDAYAGQGGLYRIDPHTGHRELVERTDLSC